MLSGAPREPGQFSAEDVVIEDGWEEVDKDLEINMNENIEYKLNLTSNDHINSNKIILFRTH